MSSNEEMSLLPCIYIITAEHSDLINIGAALGAKRQLDVLQFGCPVTLSLLDSIPVESWNDARASEARIHRQLVKQRVRGKWFNVEKDLVSVVVHSIMEDKRKASNQEKADQEAKWKKEGRLDHDSGTPFDQPPKVGKPYSNTWYRARNAWGEGWKEANTALKFS